MGELFKFSFDPVKGGIGIGNIKINIYPILTTIFRMACIAIFMYVIIKITNHLIDKVVERQGRLKFSLDERKSKTLGAVLKSMIRYAVYFFGITAILTVLFGNVTLTFAGIGGVAIGFGAQSLIKDIINGFFILFEDQFAVGDYINIEDKGGIVESIELRVTKIRDFNGDLHIIPNGLIAKVTNHSRGDMRILIEVDVAHEESIDKVTDIISGVCENYKEKEPNMVDGPKVVGVTGFKENSVTIRVVGKAKSMTQWDCENNLRKEIKKALQEKDIQIPYARRRIVKEE